MNLRIYALTALAACAADDAIVVGEDTEFASATSTSGRWPQNPIHYWIDTPGHVAGDPTQPHCSKTTGGITDAGTIAAIHQGIAAYEAQTSLHFIELTTKPTANPGFPVLIYTQSTTSPEANSGGIPPLPSTTTNWQGCVFLPGSHPAHTIQHETGHQLGLQHEQRRSDYCTTIRIDTSCMQADAHDDMGNEPFKTNPSTQILTPYDIHSIMEYANDGFCDKTLPGCAAASGTGTVCAKPPLMLKGCTGHDTSGACALGGATDFSANDLNALYRMYEPSLGSDEVNDQLGAAMASGDFDGDGYTDLAVGAIGEAPGSQVATGVVMLYKGTEGGLVAWKLLYETDFTSATVHAGDKFGAAIAAGKYFSHTNPLVDDLIIGAPGYAANSGAVFIYRSHGEDGSRQPTADRMYTDVAPSGGADHFGAAVAMGPGVIAVGAPKAAISATRNGMWFLRHLSDSAFTPFGLGNAGALTPPAGSDYGSAIAIGLGDVAVGAPGEAFGGVVVLFSTSGTFLSTISAAAQAPGDGFGKALAFMQFNGKSRLAIGAPTGGTGGTLTLASLGSPMQVTATLTQADVGNLSVEAGDQFGASLAAADLDGDGNDDLVVGSPGENNGQGIVVLFRGATNLVGWAWRNEQADGMTVPAAGDGFGTSVAAGRFGDVFDDSNAPNDAPADFAAGAPHRTLFAHANAGAFQEFLGQQNNTPVFQSGFDENRVNGIQPRRLGAPAPMSCPAIQ